jgi:ParB-like chromosome segregation protein Spo0J
MTINTNIDKLNVTKQSEKFKITVNKEYEGLVPKLTEQEYDRLKQSIQEKGQLVPIIVNKAGVIIDGHHRNKICQELGIPQPRFLVREFEDDLEEKEIVIEVNAKRRHLTDFQTAELVYEIEKIEAEKAERRQKAGKTLSPNELKGQARDIAAKRLGMSPTTYQRAKKVIEKAPEEIKQKARSGEMSISEASNRVKREEIRQELLAEKPKIDLPDGIKLIHGDFRVVGQEIPDNSIAVIFVDPPYRYEDLPLYEELGKLAGRVLIPGGSLFTYAGGYWFNRIFELIEKTSNLTYWWKIAIVYQKGHQPIFPRRVYRHHKDILRYVKGDNERPGFDFLPDIIMSGHPDKSLDDWTQNVYEAEHIIRKLTLENDIVLDPMMGREATTGKACLNLGRPFMGIESDKENYRLADATLKGYSQAVK